MKAGPRHLIATLAALALIAALPASASAALATPVRAVFLQEFSKPLYTMAQGDIVTFENDDPFLSHGVAGPFSSPTTPPGGSRLVRGASFLPAGSYSFGCTVHPGMTATMTIVDTGTPLPADGTTPSAAVSFPRLSAKRLSTGGPIRVRVGPDEPVDAEARIFVGRKLIGTGAVALPTGARGTILVTPTEGGAKLLAARLRRGGLSLKARIRVTDVAGNAFKENKSRRVKPLEAKR